jgi:hypothetical protein
MGQVILHPQQLCLYFIQLVLCLVQPCLCLIVPLLCLILGDLMVSPDLVHLMFQVSQSKLQGTGKPRRLSSWGGRKLSFKKEMRVAEIPPPEATIEAS